MAACNRIKRKNRKVCVGDLNELITIKDRSLTAARPGATGISEAFTNDKQVWAMIETTRGDQFFDGSSLQTGTTHLFYARYDASVTQEDFIFFSGNIYDILDVENLDERSNFMKIQARKRGTETINVNEG